MKSVSTLFVLICLLNLTACSRFGNKEVVPAEQASLSLLDSDSYRNLPTSAPLIVGVYEFTDQTGQRAVLDRPTSEMSTAVPQGLASMLVQELKAVDDGKWFRVVEREGISICHPARFILVGSGNPEEGELRPQLLDRFGMHAQIGTVREPDLRVKIVEQRTRFDEFPKEFREEYQDSQDALTNKITAARKLLQADSITLDYELQVKISQICSELNVDGLRGDIVTNRAAKALTAFDTRTEVTAEDIFKIVTLCLRHRLRKDPLESIDSGTKVQEVFSTVFGFE